MLITFVRNETRAVPLKIRVPEVEADTVISAMATAGWSVLSRCYGSGQTSGGLHTGDTARRAHVAREGTHAPRA